MQQIIENFLDIAVIESGKLRLEPALTSVPEILDGVGPIARLVAGKKKITLLLDAVDDTRRFSVDAPKLRQALLNFIGNAVQHSVAGQRVWVSARWEPEQVIFAVRDEGQGITPEDQARLFKAFGRAGTKKTAGERSTGLGLAIARQVVEAHGGRI
jgi:signal transduction histidine kinase